MHHPWFGRGSGNASPTGRQLQSADWAVAQGGGGGGRRGGGEEDIFTRRNVRLTDGQCEVTPCDTLTKNVSGGDVCGLCLSACVLVEGLKTGHLKHHHAACGFSVLSRFVYSRH